MPKRFVVAGATGRVGSVVARELLSRGHHVRALVRDRAAAGRVDPRAEPMPVRWTLVPRAERVVTVATTLEQTLRDALARSAA
jgi:uncharacterized protein YbjT (DUF2867 family)